MDGIKLCLYPYEILLNGPSLLPKTKKHLHQPLAIYGGSRVVDQQRGGDGAGPDRVAADALNKERNHEFHKNCISTFPHFHISTFLHFYISTFLHQCNYVSFV